MNVGAPPEMIQVSEVLDVLNRIVDPCSAAAGVPAGLVDMGLVRSVSVQQGEVGPLIEVALLTTHPFCMMGAVFISEATERLASLPGAPEVRVALDASVPWSPDLMKPDYAARLNANRAERGHPEGAATSLTTTERPRAAAHA